MYRVASCWFCLDDDAETILIEGYLRFIGSRKIIDKNLQFHTFKKQ